MLTGQRFACLAPSTEMPPSSAAVVAWQMIFRLRLRWLVPILDSMLIAVTLGAEVDVDVVVAVATCGVTVVPGVSIIGGPLERGR